METIANTIHNRLGSVDYELVKDICSNALSDHAMWPPYYSHF